MEAGILFGVTSKNKSKIRVEKDLTLVSLKSLVTIYFPLSSLSLKFVLGRGKSHICWIFV